MAKAKQADQLSEDIKALVRGANFGHLATLMRDVVAACRPGVGRP
jgi:hypothetical protein